MTTEHNPIQAENHAAELTGTEKAPAEITITVQGNRSHIGTSTVAGVLALAAKGLGFAVTLNSEDRVEAVQERLQRIDQNDDFDELAGKVNIVINDETPGGNLKNLLAEGLGSTLHLVD